MVVNNKTMDLNDKLVASAVPMRAGILSGFVSPRQPEVMLCTDNKLHIPHHEMVCGLQLSTSPLDDPYFLEHEFAFHAPVSMEGDKPKAYLNIPDTWV